MDTNIFKINDNYLMLALDHRGSFEKLVNENKQDNQDSATIQELIDIKKEIINSVKDISSGLLIDTQYGLPAYKDIENNFGIKAPYLLPIEKTGYEDVEGERITKLELSAREIDNLGAKGVKILIYFNPEVKSAYTQIETSKKAIEDSHYNNLPIFLEIVNYETPLNPKHSVYESVKMFVDNNVVPDVFKLEYPGSIEEAKKITDLLGNTPWILLTRGVDFEVFYEQLKDCIEGGCKGFLAGRALWQEGVSMSKENRKDFFDNILKDRFTKICNLFQI